MLGGIRGVCLRRDGRSDRLMKLGLPAYVLLHNGLCVMAFQGSCSPFSVMNALFPSTGCR